LIESVWGNDRMNKLDGKIAIVTGSGRGIGRAIAVKLAQEGAHCVINDLDEESANETCNIITNIGRQAKAVIGDITEPEFGDRLVNAAIDNFGGIDIIINNAGYIWNRTIQKHSDEQWYAMLDIHATAPFRILRAAAHYFKNVSKQEQAKGVQVCRKVVNVSSIAGQQGAATQLGYSAGKAAIIGMTKTLAKEWGRYNVTVNCVSFGLIHTRLTQRLDGGPQAIDIKGRKLNVGLEPGIMDMISALTPLGRGGTPEEAAGAVYLLCIPESDYITGQTLACSGGFVQ
jgi:3-oxoacyl-[acyl-carrier protein] reductase